MRTRRALAALVPLAVLSLTACGGEDSEPAAEESSASASESPSETPSESPTESETPMEEETPAEDEAAAPAGDLTEPGSELAIGDAATLPVNDGAGVLELTVASIDKGTSKEISEFEFTGGDKPSDYTPFYIKVTGKVVSGDVANEDPTSDIDGMIGDQGATRLIEFGNFGPCEGESFQQGAKAGDTLESCTIALAPKGQTVDGALFSDSGSDAKYNPYDGNQVTWS